jgi:hypothetical protein
MGWVVHLNHYGGAGPTLHTILMGWGAPEPFGGAGPTYTLSSWVGGRLNLSVGQDPHPTHYPHGLGGSPEPFGGADPTLRTIPMGRVVRLNSVWFRCGLPHCQEADR